MTNNFLINNSTTTPLVSVCIITFNQEKYIEQSILSAISQNTNFFYEIIIGNDLSTDKTQEKLNTISNKYKITVINNQHNIGATRNFSNVLKSAKGKYIALLEGDDYWIDVNKLQLQVDFMEENTNFSSVFHSVEMIDRNANLVSLLPRNSFKKSSYCLKDLIVYDSFMPTCSILFRNKLFNYFPDEFYTSRNMCDWPLNLFNAEHGDIGFIDKCMAVYRTSSSEAAWSSQRLKNILESAIKVNNVFNTYFKYKYNKLFEKKIINYKFQITVDLLRHGELKDGLLYFKKQMIDSKSFFYIFRIFNIIFLKSISVGIVKLLLNKKSNI